MPCYRHRRRFLLYKSLVASVCCRLQTTTPINSQPSETHPEQHIRLYLALLTSACTFFVSKAIRQKFCGDQPGVSLLRTCRC
ncbi:hypothetical protein BDV12DRAFT_170244 [Aspergillus spectabilis]